MEIESALTQYITQELAIGRLKSISPDDDLIAAGVLDSLALMELILFIEERLAIPIPTEDIVIDNFRTVRVLADYLDRQRSAGGPAAEAA